MMNNDSCFQYTFSSKSDILFEISWLYFKFTFLSISLKNKCGCIMLRVIATIITFYKISKYILYKPMLFFLASLVFLKDEIEQNKQSNFFCPISNHLSNLG